MEKELSRPASSVGHEAIFGVWPNAEAENLERLHSQSVTKTSAGEEE